MSYEQKKQVAFWRNILDTQGVDEFLKVYHGDINHERAPYNIPAARAFKEYFENEELMRPFRQEEREVETLKLADRANQLAIDAHNLAKLAAFFPSYQWSQSSLLLS